MKHKCKTAGNDGNFEAWIELRAFCKWHLQMPVLAFGYCCCLLLCMCVCVYKCPCVNHLLVLAITIQALITKFGPTVQNTSVKIPIVLGESTVTFKFYPILSLKFVSTMTHYLFKLGSPNLDQSYKPLVNPRLLHGSNWFTVSTLCTYTYVHEETSPAKSSH